mmetsp:Transcript_21305/g.38565  ORF Transcript_21305/g.38565 Transcript_21305/m.38565 type:complete len:163 (-) Transcript_21305:1125-1613(-)
MLNFGRSLIKSKNNGAGSKRYVKKRKGIKIFNIYLLHSVTLRLNRIFISRFHQYGVSPCIYHANNNLHHDSPQEDYANQERQTLLSGDNHAEVIPTQRHQLFVPTQTQVSIFQGHCQRCKDFLCSIDCQELHHEESHDALNNQLRVLLRQQLLPFLFCTRQS